MRLRSRPRRSRDDSVASGVAGLGMMHDSDGQGRVGVRPGGRAGRRAWLACACLVLAGCADQVIDPFRDASAVPEGALSTASADDVRAAGKSAVIRVRDWQAWRLKPEDGAVTHWPLWWQDPFEQKGSDDGRIAWTWEDYVGFAYCPWRFALNTAALPISVVVNPPGQVLCSDGRISKQLLWADHDAAVCRHGHPGPDTFVAVGVRAMPAPSTQPTTQPVLPIPKLSWRQVSRP